MVNVVVLNVFVLIYFKKDLNFGVYDYCLFFYMFGLFCVGGFVVVYFGIFGFNGIL